MTKRFYWPGIRTDVENHVKKCAVDEHHTSPVNLNRAPMGNIAVLNHLHFGQWITCMGPLPETRRENKHTLVVVDHLTQCVRHLLHQTKHGSTTFNEQNKTRYAALRPGYTQ